MPWESRGRGSAPPQGPRGAWSGTQVRLTRWEGSPSSPPGVGSERAEGRMQQVRDYGLGQEKMWKRERPREVKATSRA